MVTMADGGFNEFQVNTAARMESTGQPLRIQCSESTRQLLTTGDNGRSQFHLELRGETAVKGKGLMQTYWLMAPP